MPKFRPRLNTVREHANQKRKTARQIKPSRKIENIRLRYSKIPNPKLSSNTLYRPSPKYTAKRKQVKPTGHSWNMFLRELNQPVTRRSFQKYHESLKPVQLPVQVSRPPKLRFSRTTEKENRNLLNAELNKSPKRPPLGIKI